MLLERDTRAEQWATRQSRKGCQALNRRTLKVGLVGNPASVHLQVYWRYLCDQGHTVDVIGWGSPTDPRMTFVSVEPRHRFSGLPLGLLTLISRQVRICWALLHGRYDVVSLQFVTAYAVMAGLCRRGPLHMSFWGSDLNRLDTQPRNVRVLVPWLLKRADAIQSVSQHMTAELVRRGAPPDRVETFQYGIDADFFKPAEDLAVREPALLLSSRALSSFYRIDVLLKAMAEVGVSRPECRLVLTNDGPDAEELKSLAASLGVADKVEFVGKVELADLLALLQRASVWVSVPPTDGTPLSLLEAMSCGAYPVVADYQSLREWIEPGCGNLVTDVTSSGVASALSEAMDRAATGDHINRNREKVLERADRSKNLRRYEETLVRLAAR